MAPPPPPRAPPPPPPPAPSANGQAVENAAGALFAEISALGEHGIRSSLKKATRGPVNDKVPEVSEKNVPQKSLAKNTSNDEVPKCELMGNKWNVEYQVGNQEIKIDAEMKHTIYVFKCRDSLIKVSGKVNAIVLDSCSKTACIFEEAMASFEIVNSRDIQIQCIKTAPAITIDGCTAVTYYMSKSFAESQVITAKCAAINLIRPTDDDDIVETPIPEQFCTKWKDGNWVTEAVSHDD